MKDKNLPPDNNTSSLEELTDQANQIIESLENEKDLNNSVESYQQLLKLNNVIEKKFHKNFRSLSEETNKTPTVAKLNETTNASTSVNPIWNAPTFIPIRRAYVSSKLITIICLKKINNKVIDKAEIPANTYM